MEVAVRVVQVACTLCQHVQESLLRPSSNARGRVHSKLDRSPVTVADWGVQAIVSWLLSDSFHDESISIVAEEDDETLSSSDGAALLEFVVEAVNGCLVEAPRYGLRSPEKELRALDVIQAIRKCSSAGGPKGRFWVLDPVDGTLGFV
uniref:Uncharacterized protein n=1 Tax=Arundo donax TaxID=35708 RepID=A0A0A9DA15_ARUDO